MDCRFKGFLTLLIEEDPEFWTWLATAHALRRMFLSENEGRKMIIIIDITVNHVGTKKMVDKKSIETQLMFDTLMMATIAGKEHSESELVVGFTHYNITQYAWFEVSYRCLSLKNKMVYHLESTHRT
ncbi:hypothetical protein ACFX2B_040156 [Malus domestica]